MDGIKDLSITGVAGTATGIAALGASGWLYYQCVVPLNTRVDELRELINIIRDNSSRNAQLIADLQAENERLRARMDGYEFALRGYQYHQLSEPSLQQSMGIPVHSPHPSMLSSPHQSLPNTGVQYPHQPAPNTGVQYPTRIPVGGGYSQVHHHSTIPNYPPLRDHGGYHSPHSTTGHSMPPNHSTSGRNETPTGGSEVADPRQVAIDAMNC